MPWGVAAAGIGAAGSIAASSMQKGPAGQTTSSSTQQPWEPYGSQLSNLYNWTEQAARAPGTPGALTPAYYGGQTYAGLTPQGTGALNSIYGNQSAGQMIGQAGNTLGQTAGGAYTQGGTQNPFFQGAFQGIADQIRPGVDSGFEGGGRYGSGSANQAKASALTNAGMQMGYQNYSTERQNQLNAATALPGIAQASYMPAQMQLGAAQVQQADTQGQMNADKARYDYTANMPYMNLQRYQGLLTPGGGGSGTQSQPFFQPSMAQNAIGGGLGGAAIGSLISGGQPAGGGGGIGSLFGYGQNSYNYGAPFATSAPTSGPGWNNGMGP